MIQADRRSGSRSLSRYGESQWNSMLYEFSTSGMLDLLQAEDRFR